MNSLFGSLTSGEAPPLPRPRLNTDQSQTQRLDIGHFTLPTASIDDDELRRQQAVSELDKALVALGVAFHGDYGMDLDSGSRQGLRRFVRQTPMLSKPSIGAQSNGRIVATWKQGGRILSVEFTDRLRFNFALTIEVDGIPRRSWGTAHALTFFEAQPQAETFVFAA